MTFAMGEDIGARKLRAASTRADSSEYVIELSCRVLRSRCPRHETDGPLLSDEPAALVLSWTLTPEPCVDSLAAVKHGESGRLRVGRDGNSSVSSFRGGFSGAVLQASLQDTVVPSLLPLLAAFRFSYMAAFADMYPTL